MLIAQVTDTHLRPRGSVAYGKVDTVSSLERCIAHLNELKPAPDVVLMTGDLTDKGTLEETGLLREIVAPLTAPVFLIPGNHDRREALRQVFGDLGYLPAEGTFLHYVIEDYPLRMIGLDTVVPGAPHGELCAERLAWLAARLEEAPERPTLLFMHHPPFRTGLDFMDSLKCRNGEALGALIEQHRQVERIVCGHVHRSIQLQWHGTTASIAPSSSHAVTLDLVGEPYPSYMLEPPSCALHLWLEGTGLVSHLSFIGGDYGPHPFVDADGNWID